MNTHQKPTLFFYRTFATMHTTSFKDFLMRDELKQQITINLNRETVDYFKALSAQNGIPYQTLINLYLNDVVENKKELKLKWE